MANARQLYFWIGMSEDIRRDMEKCPECLQMKPMELLMPTKATRPFEAVSVDLGQLKGAYCLVLVDRYTGWPLVHKLRKLDT